MLQVREGAHEQPGRDEQHQRQRNFRDHQPRPEPPVRWTGHPVSAGLQCVGRSRASGLQRGEAAEEQRAHSHHADRERERQAIDAEIEHVRLRDDEQLGQRVTQQPQAPERQRETDNRTGGRQQDALGEELAYQPRASGAERGANRELALAGNGAREQQVRDVRARQQQHDRDRGQRDERDGRRLEHLAQPAHLDQLGAQTAIGLRMIGF